MVLASFPILHIQFHNFFSRIYIQTINQNSSKHSQGEHAKYLPGSEYHASQRTLLSCLTTHTNSKSIASPCPINQYCMPYHIIMNHDAMISIHGSRLRNSLSCMYCVRCRKTLCRAPGSLRCDCPCPGHVHGCPILPPSHSPGLWYPNAATTIPVGYEILSHTPI